MFIRYRFSELIRVLRLTVVVVVHDTGWGGQAGTAEPGAALRRGFRETLGERGRLLGATAQTLNGPSSKQGFCLFGKVNCQPRPEEQKRVGWTDENLASNLRRPSHADLVSKSQRMRWKWDD